MPRRQHSPKSRLRFNLPREVRRLEAAVASLRLAIAAER